MLKNYLTLLTIGLIWGSQFIFQTMALEAFSPVWIGTLRAVFGAFTVGVICRFMGLHSTSNQWKLFAMIGLLEATIPFVLVPWAQKELSSSVTAILMGTLPFYALLLAPLFIQNSKVTKGSLFSVCIGFAGLMVLFYPDLISGNQQFNMLSAFAVILAAVCFAIALLLLNKVQAEHPMIVARNVLIMASLQLVIFASVTAPFTLGEVSSHALGSIIYLGVMCAGVVYYLYMMSIKNAGAVFTSMTNYLVPAVGVFIAALVTDESIQTTTWVALVVILSALLFKQMAEKNEQ
ncbi:DMT family transporter [Vibrio alginolyticus]|uniref:DMT family transporter n=1 Tax=Vibrio alginolyticus TaxID=663 RepID=UPI003D7D685B